MNSDPRLPRPNSPAFYVRLIELFREIALAVNSLTSSALPTKVANNVLGTDGVSYIWQPRTRTSAIASPGSARTANFDLYEAIEYSNVTDDIAITLSGGTAGHTYGIAISCGTLATTKYVTFSGATVKWAGTTGAPILAMSTGSLLRFEMVKNGASTFWVRLTYYS